MGMIFKVIVMLLMVVLVSGCNDSRDSNGVLVCLDDVLSGDISGGLEELKKVKVEGVRDKDLLGGYYTCLGAIYMSSGDYGKAYKYIAEGSKYISGDNYVGYWDIVVGRYYYYMGDMDNGLRYGIKAKVIGEGKGYSDIVNHAYVLIGDIYYYKGLYDSALGSYNKVIHNLKEGLEKAVVYKNLGFIFLKKGNGLIAEDYFRRAYEIFEASGDRLRSGEVMMGLGAVKVRWGDIEEGREYLEKGIKLVRGDYWTGFYYEQRGLYYIRKGDKDLGYDYLKRVYDIFKSLGADVDVREVGKLIEEYFSKS
jgi:tetratricopeptide (TPR) repeat protein